MNDTERRKEEKTLDVLLNIYSYLVISESYIENCIQNNEILHISLIIQKMLEEYDKIFEYYEVLEDTRKKA